MDIRLQKEKEKTCLEKELDSDIWNIIGSFPTIHEFRQIFETHNHIGSEADFNERFGRDAAIIKTSKCTKDDGENEDFKSGPKGSFGKSMKDHQCMENFKEDDIFKEDKEDKDNDYIDGAVDNDDGRRGDGCDDHGDKEESDGDEMLIATQRVSNQDDHVVHI